MAADRIVDSSRLNAALLAEANAIRARTGAVGSISFDLENGKGFSAAIAAIGGTAALPPVINRIDGGSFTPASDTRLSLYSVSHGMGVQPKGFFLWCDDNEESGGAYPVQTALFGYILRVNADYGGSSSSGSFNVTYRKTNDYVTGVSLTLSEAQLDQAMTTASCSFAWRNGEYYKAGCTYKWLVWA